MLIVASQLFTIELYIAAFLSNSWYTIGAKESKQVSNETFRVRLHFGLFYMCAWPTGDWLWHGIGNSNGNGEVNKENNEDDDNDDRCFMLTRTDESSLAAAKYNASRLGLLASRLNDKHLLDIEPRRTAQSQLLACIGLACLLLGAVLALLMLTIRRPISGHTRFYMCTLLVMHTLDVVPRLGSLVLLTVSAREYLDYVLRSSYRSYTRINFDSAQYVELIEKRLSKYQVATNWPYWLAVASMATAMLSVVIACAYLTFDYRRTMKKKKTSRSRGDHSITRLTLDQDRLLQQKQQKQQQQRQEKFNNATSQSDGLAMGRGSQLLRKRSSSWAGLQSYQIAFNKDFNKFCVKMRRNSSLRAST
jgi:hypothetical protein